MNPSLINVCWHTQTPHLLHCRHLSGDSPLPPSTPPYQPFRHPFTHFIHHISHNSLSSLRASALPILLSLKNHRPLSPQASHLQVSTFPCLFIALKPSHTTIYGLKEQPHHLQSSWRKEKGKEGVEPLYFHLFWLLVKRVFSIISFLHSFNLTPHLLLSFLDIKTLVKNPCSKKLSPSPPSPPRHHCRRRH